MKKTTLPAVCLLLILTLVSCGETVREQGPTYNGKSVNDVLSLQASDGSSAVAQSGTKKTQNGPYAAGEFDVDLTVMNSAMVYAQVYDMLTNPDDYLNKKVRMKGSFTYAEGDGRMYFACIIADATACCSQGIEFVLKDERTFPEGYPAVGDEITVWGTFGTYYEGQYRYCQLTDAVMGWNND